MQGRHSSDCLLFEKYPGLFHSIINKSLINDIIMNKIKLLSYLQSSQGVVRPVMLL